LQLSVVQGLLSSTLTGVPAWQMPPPLQISAPLHRFPSLHDVLADAGGFVHPVGGEHVPAMWQASWATQMSAVPP
jgi:hypothetical protein